MQRKVRAVPNPSSGRLMPSFFDGNLTASVALGMLAAGGYVLAHARHRQFHFTLLDVLIVTAIMAVVTGVSMPLVGAAGEQAKAASLKHNLHTLRAQVQLYKVEHGGQPPILYEGALPQLTEATNARGVPGPPGEEYPFGPYLAGGIPPNPYTGISTVTATDRFPPQRPSGVGGWLFHQPTGQICADLDGHLGQ